MRSLDTIKNNKFRFHNPVKTLDKLIFHKTYFALAIRFLQINCQFKPMLNLKHTSHHIGQLINQSQPMIH